MYRRLIWPKQWLKVSALGKSSKRSKRTSWNLYQIQVHFGNWSSDPLLHVDKIVNIRQNDNILTSISLASHFRDICKQCRHWSDAEAASEQAAASDQDFHCLLTRISIRNRKKNEKVHQTPLKLEMDSSNWYGWKGPLGKCGLSKL